MNNKRQMISIFSNIFSVFVSAGISFLLTPYLVGSVGKEAYSYYPLANNFVSYMTIITLALNSMASRFITIEVTRGNDEKAHRYFSSVFYSNVILSFCLLLPMTVIVLFINSFLNVSVDVIKDVQILFSCTFASMIINLISSVFDVATFAKNRMDWRAGRDIGQNILRALMFIFLFTNFRSTIAYLGIVSVIVALLNGVVQFIFNRKLMPDYNVHLNEFDKKAVFELVKSGLWNSISNVGSVLTMSVSVLLANIMLGASESGDLSIIQVAPHFVSSVITAVYGVLLSRITIVYAQNSKNETIKCVQDSQKVLGIICTVPAVLLILLGNQFFRLWVPEENAGYLQILSIITMVPILIHSMMWTVYGLNVTNNKLKVPALTLIGTGVFSILLTVVLIRFTDLGVYAISIASSICNSLFYLLFIPAYTAKKIHIPAATFYYHIIRSFIFVSVMMAIGIPIVYAIGPSITSWFRFIIVGAALEIAGLLLYLFIVYDSDSRKLFVQQAETHLKHLRHR